MRKIGLLFLIACSTGTNAAAERAIRVCYQDYREELTTVALQVAEAKRYFADEGLKIDWVKKTSLSKAAAADAVRKSNLNRAADKSNFIGMKDEIGLLQASIADNCDFTSTIFEAIVGSKIDVSQIHPVASYQYGKEYDTHLVVRKDSNISSVKDLKGKRVRTTQIGSLLAFQSLLKSAGLSPDDVKYEWMKVGDLPKALDERKVDAVISYNPTISLLLGSDRVRILVPNILSTYYKKPIPHSMLVVRNSFQKENPDLYKKFMSAFGKASAELSHRPESAVYAVPDVQSSYSNAQIEKSLSFFNVGRPLLLDGMTKKEFFEQTRFLAYEAILQDQGFIKDSVNLASWRE